MAIKIYKSIISNNKKIMKLEFHFIKKRLFLIMSLFFLIFSLSVVFLQNNQAQAAKNCCYHECKLEEAKKCIGNTVYGCVASCEGDTDPYNDWCAVEVCSSKDICREGSCKLRKESKDKPVIVPDDPYLCEQTCATEPGCRDSLENSREAVDATTGSGDCCSGGHCLECSPGFVWDGDTEICGSGCVDNDLDGYFGFDPIYCMEGDDCDDDNKYQAPGNIETCDNLDNNCNGIVDEECDNDRDGYCSKYMSFYNYPVRACLKSNLPDGFKGDDCEVDFNDVNPGAEEVCDDRDNNCDGIVDEGCGGNNEVITDPFCIVTKTDHEPGSYDSLVTLIESKVSLKKDSIGIYDVYRFNFHGVDSIGIEELFSASSTGDCAGKVNSIWTYDVDKYPDSTWGTYYFDSPFPWLSTITDIEKDVNYQFVMDEDCVFEYPEADFYKVDYCEDSCDNGKCVYVNEDSCTSWDTLEENYAKKYMGNELNLWITKDMESENKRSYEFRFRDAYGKVPIEEFIGPESTYGCAGAIESVWLYDVELDKWDRFDYSNPFPWLNTLEFIETDKIYIIFVTEECTLSSPDIDFFEIKECLDGCENGECLVIPDSICVQSDYYGPTYDFMEKKATDTLYQRADFGNNYLTYLMFDFKDKEEIDVQDLFLANNPFGCSNTMHGIWTFDNETDGWLNYDPQLPVFMNTLSKIREGEMYQPLFRDTCTWEAPDVKFIERVYCAEGCENGECVMIPMEIALENRSDATIFEYLDKYQNPSFEVKVVGGKGPFEYKWSSSVDGVFNEDDLQSPWSARADNLTVGIHGISVTVIDSLGTILTESTEIRIFKGDDLKSPIVTPVSGVTKAMITGENIYFSTETWGGEAPYYYEWKSSLDGIISTTSNFSISSLSGTGVLHTISLKVLDDAGSVFEDIRYIRIESDIAINGMSPDMETYQNGENVFFNTETSGLEDTFHSYFWESNLDGYIGNEKSFFVNTLSEGTHEILLTIQKTINNHDPLIATATAKVVIESSVCIDRDGDGYGVEDKLQCVNSGVDCDDTKSAIYPGRLEIPGNGIDENCDGIDGLLMEVVAPVSENSEVEWGNRFVVEIQKLSNNLNRTGNVQVRIRNSNDNVMLDWRNIGDGGYGDDLVAQDDLYTYGFSASYDPGEYIIDINVSNLDQFVEYLNVRSFTIVNQPTCLNLTNNGSSDDKLDIVFIPVQFEDFAEAEQKMKEAREGILSIAPFTENSDKINFHMLSRSLELGCKTTEDGPYSYACSPNNDNFKVLASVCDVDIVVLIRKGIGTAYSGINVGWAFVPSDYSTWPTVIDHELGHGFAGLADEYYTSSTSYNDFYHLDIEPWEPNITTLVDFDSKWKPLLAEDTPIPTPAIKDFEDILGVYEGGGYVAKGVYRPRQDCLMKTFNDTIFCGACEQAIIKMIQFYTE